ncbi:MAG TPA: DUF899 domain-containing protein [Solirubrobacteraceae bacterium]|nr:DUF899 domain-containing protein [Solirubrobacteraceae bacterium]
MDVVSEMEWKDALNEIRAEEKRLTRAHDALAAKRRRLPAVAIDTPYRFLGPDGEIGLREMFEGRRQLILYHFMFAPGVAGWPDAGCDGCSMFADQIGDLAHLHARDTTVAFVSLAPLENLEAYRRRMGWSVPWYSSAGSDFNRDFGLTGDDGESFGLSVFVTEGDRVLRTYFTDSRGVEALGSVWTFLDLTPLGRQENWEDSPPDRPQGDPYTWWHRHDEYARS